MNNQETLISSDGPTTSGSGACLLCNRNEGPVVWQEHGYDVHYCADCGVAYLDPPPPPEQVDLTTELHDDSYYSRPAKLRADWLESIRPGGKLLEVGCGAGHFLVECRKRGFEVSGCEPDTQRAELCRSTHGIDVETAYIENSNLPAGEFDIVFHVDLLSHFVDPVESLRAMTRLLRPGGILCFEVGTLGGVDTRWYRWNGGLACPDHRWFFSLEGINNVLDQAGLKIEQSKQFGLVPSMLPLVLGRKFIKPLVQLRRGAGARPWHGEAAEQGQLRKVKGIYSLGQWVEFQLRYRLGPFVPKQGPTTLFIAASPK